MTAQAVSVVDKNVDAKVITITTKLEIVDRFVDIITENTDIYPSQRNFTARDVTYLTCKHTITHNAISEPISYVCPTCGNYGVLA